MGTIISLSIWDISSVRLPAKHMTNCQMCLAKVQVQTVSDEPAASNCSTLKMIAAGSSETSVLIYQSTQRRIRDICNSERYGDL
jgi:hypothetical protein